MKKVLILCTGNSCRSIMAEGLLNRYFGDVLQAFSAGSKPAGRVNANAKKILQKEGAWRDAYHSKSIEEVMQNAPFDLIITVCDSAKESCPLIPGVRMVHVGFEDPDGKGYEAFEKLAKEMKERLFAVVKQEISKEI